MAIILAYIFYFIAATASPLQRRWLATNKNETNDGQINLAFKVSSFMVLGSLVLPFFKPFQHIENIYLALLLALISGIFGAGYFIFSYIAQKHVEAGTTTLVSNIYTPTTIILATLFLNEGLKSTQLLGTTLLLIGMFIVSNKHKISIFKFDKWFLMILCSGVMLGIALTAEKALLNIGGFTIGTMMSWCSQAIILGLATFIYNSPNKYNFKDVATTGVLRFLQSLSWVILLVTVDNLSLVSAITTFKVVIIFIVAAIFLNERDELKQKIIGSLIATAGLLII